MRRYLSFFALVALLAALPGCMHTPALPMLAAVPDSSARLSYDLPRSEAERGAMLDVALGQAVCLLRTANAPECRRGVESPCVVMTPQQVDALRDRLRPAFQLVGDVRLRSAFTTDTAITNHLPGAKAATVLADARRTTPCRDWNGGACAAFSYEKLWFQLAADAPPIGQATPVQRLTVFLADRVCTADPRGRPQG